MRLIIWLAAPIGIVAAITMATILVAWADGADLCNSWLSVILPFFAPNAVSSGALGGSFSYASPAGR
jgi:hypothetical protein